MTTIYALSNEDKLFYIGQTTNLDKRIYDHIRNMNLPGLTYQQLEICEDEEGLKREKYYIKKYVSEGAELVNKNHAKDNKLDEIDGQILQLLANDLHAYEMAEHLWLSVRTIETRIQHIKRKMKIKHIGGLMCKAYEMGLVV